MIKIGTKGALDGFTVEIVDAKKWGAVWVYKVLFFSTIEGNDWHEYLTKKQLGNFRNETY